MAIKQHTVYVRTAISAACAAGSFLLASCHDMQAADMTNFTDALNDYLAHRGNLCLAKYDWPIVVTSVEQQAGDRDAVQMPVLEKRGLVTSKDTMVIRKTDDGTMMLRAREYALTAQGMKYYLHEPVIIATATSRITHSADFCVAKLSLDRIIGWEPPLTRDGKTKTVVTFTYKIDPAPWTSSPDVRRVFPIIARVIEGAGTMQLREGFTLMLNGWVANELFDD